MEKKPLPFSDFQMRLLSGVVLCPLSIALIALGGWYFMGMVMLAAVIAFYEWCGLIENSDHRYRDLILGSLYLLTDFISFVSLRLAFEQGAWIALSAIVCVWASDSGAYLIGKKFGRRKLAPKISPNKTWEGFAAAMVFSGLALLLMVWAKRYVEPTHFIYVFLAGCALGAVGQGGDLLKSVFKRRAGVKDSGNLIPGHGGLLDRIDSLLLVSPVFLICVMLWTG